MKLANFLGFIEKWPISLMPLIILFLIPFTVYSQPPSTAPVAREPEYSASLSLSPAQTAVGVGEVLQVSVLLDSGEARIDGVDAVLRYNPKMLEFLELEAGNLFEEYISEEADSQAGTVNLAAVTFSPAAKNGVLGTLLFRTLKKGTTSIFFEFTPGVARSDSNVALTGAGGEDILKEVRNGRYVIEWVGH